MLDLAGPLPSGMCSNTALGRCPGGILTTCPSLTVCQLLNLFLRKSPDTSNSSLKVRLSGSGGAFLPITPSTVISHISIEVFNNSFLQELQEVTVWTYSPTQRWREAVQNTTTSIHTSSQGVITMTTSAWPLTGASSSVEEFNPSQWDRFRSQSCVSLDLDTKFRHLAHQRGDMIHPYTRLFQLMIRRPRPPPSATKELTLHLTSLAHPSLI